MLLYVHRKWTAVWIHYILLGLQLLYLLASTKSLHGTQKQKCHLWSNTSNKMHTHTHMYTQLGISLFAHGNPAYSIICFWKTCSDKLTRIKMNTRKCYDVSSELVDKQWGFMYNGCIHNSRGLHPPPPPPIPPIWLGISIIHIHSDT